MRGATRRARKARARRERTLVARARQLLEEQRSTATDGEELAPEPVIRFRDVTKGFDDRAVLDGASADFLPGVTALVGKSGVGKSTLLNVLGGITAPDSGTIEFFGEALRFASSRVLERHRARGVVWVFQDLNLVAHLTAEENAALSLIAQGMPREEAIARARARLVALGLEHRLRGRPSALSVGERQRVAIARASESPAPIVLADEPTGSLDPKTARSVMEAFVQLAADTGKSVVLVTHDHEAAFEFATQVFELHDGRLEVQETNGSKE